MAYKAIYRRFRPKLFKDLVGQEHIGTILKNQIKTENVAHAYLFSGIRGTGKTSAAKIFARAVNCLEPEDGEPCNTCKNCKASLDENMIDIVEIDAASNNKVEDIRELREGINYPPSKGKYKVYIVDEVHMLSQSAFNAFLKTLEEPPSYVVFILATTEMQKIPATIISRCQRYEFKRISSESIAKNMKKICQEVDFQIEDKSLNLIARNSEGAMRDALSILDQSISAFDGKVDYEDILDSLGSVNNTIMVDFMDKLISRSEGELMDSLQSIIRSGKDIGRFAKDVIHYFRNIMILKTGANCYEILDEPQEVIEEIERQSREMDMERVVDYMEMMNRAENDIKNSTQPRIILELSIIKLLEYGKREELLKRIEKLEKAMESGRLEVKKQDNSSNIKPIKLVQRHHSNTSDKKTIASKASDDKEEARKNYPSKDMSFNDILGRWSDALNYIKKKKISLHALVTEGCVTSYDRGKVTIEFTEKFGFHKEAVSQAHNKEYVEGFLSEFFDTDLSVEFEMESLEPKEIAEDLSAEVVSLFGKDKVEIED